MKLPKSLRKYLCGFDTFVRHCCVADLGGDFRPDAILDVGGEGFLGLFTHVPVINVNVKSADVRYSGIALPFKDKTVDIVVSCDTLEHIPGRQRTAFLGELVRVGRKGVVLCAPYGTPEHVDAEKHTAKGGYLSEEVRHYLEEHILHGLPTPKEVEEMRRRWNGKIFFQGDFRLVGGSGKGRVSSYLFLLRQALANGLAELSWKRERHLSDTATQFTNRFFIVIDKRA